ncbi:MAG: hypothetical protein ACOY0T_09875 [Myxococcota bacterium]
MSVRTRIALLMLIAAACRSRNDAAPPSPAPSAPSVPASTSAALPPTAAPRAEPPALPTLEDFEESASQEISGKNLEQELDKLERELTKP